MLCFEKKEIHFIVFKVREKTQAGLLLTSSSCFRFFTFLSFSIFGFLGLNSELGGRKKYTHVTGAVTVKKNYTFETETWTSRTCNLKEHSLNINITFSL